MDVSRAAVRICRDKFAADPTKSFFLYDGACFVDRAGLFAADLALSLDVIYHLVEDPLFETYLTHLFAAGSYGTLFSMNPATGEIARTHALRGEGRADDSLQSFQEALNACPHFVPALEGVAQIEYARRSPDAMPVLM